VRRALDRQDPSAWPCELRTVETSLERLWAAPQGVPGDLLSRTTAL